MLESQWRARNKCIYDMRLAGKTYDAIAEEFKLSRERVRAIVLQVDRIIDKACTRYFEAVTTPEIYGVWHTFTHEGRQRNKNVPSFPPHA